MGTVQERRQHKRYPADGIHINIKMLFATGVKVCNLSLGGISFETDRRLNVGRSYKFRMETQGLMTTVEGIIVWCSLIKSSKDAKENIVPVYRAGMKFTNVLREKMSLIVDSMALQNGTGTSGEENDYFDLSLSSLDMTDTEKSTVEEHIRSLM
jgi:hypothetical protein